MPSWRRKQQTTGDWNEYARLLREKWSEVPVLNRVLDTNLLMQLDDTELLDLWTEARMKDDFASREWYRLMYSPIFKGKRIIDLGCGFGFDAATFASQGAHVTSIDILSSNVTLVQRVIKLQKLDGVDFLYLEKLEDLDRLPLDYDFVWCAGSFHNAPQQIMRQEAQAIVKHLKVGGRWIELAYPKSRWERDGRPAFDKWGSKTDSGAPWIEWYDVDKLQSLLRPATFKVVMYFEYHNKDFNWFDLLRTN